MPEIKDTTELRDNVELILKNVEQTVKKDQAKIDHLLKSAIQLKDTLTFFTICESIYHFYYRNGLYEESILFLKAAQETLGDVETHFGDFNNWFGNNYGGLKFPIESLEHYFKSVIWYEKYQVHNVTIPLGNIASVYFENESYGKALEYNELALGYSLKLTDEKDKLYNLIFDYFRIGEIYQKLGETSKATDYFEKSLTVARKHKGKNMMLLSILKALNFYGEIEKFNLCEKLIIEGNNIVNDFDSNQSVLAKAFLLYRDQHYLNSGNIDKARHPKDIHSNIPMLKSKILSYSAKYYAKVNDINNTAKFYEELLEENKKIERKSRMKVLSNIEQKYLNRKLKKKNEELIRDIKGGKKIIYIILFFLVLVSGLLILLLKQNEKYKLINNLLKNKTQELKNSNEELERFTFIASHDLKTPLRAIVSFTSLLEIKLKSYKNDSVHEYLSFIKKGGLRLNNLIESTLEYSRISNTKKLYKEEEIDLNLLFNELKDTLSHFIKERNSTIVKLNQLPTIKAHKASILVLFQNLIENGIKYNKSNTPTIKIYTKQHQKFFSVFISDNGIGISSEYYDKVFKMFSRLHNQKEYEGSGLGLSICKKIVDKLNGEIFIESKDGEGCVFEIKMPNALNPYA